MIPTTNSILTTDLEMIVQPSRQHRMDLNTNRITGTCDGLEAVTQSVYKILNTERYAYIIYSWDYGIELMDLYGKNPALVCPELERRIKDALYQDDRITGIDRFHFDTANKGAVTVTFTVHSIFGNINEELKVNI